MAAVVLIFPDSAVKFAGAVWLSFALTASPTQLPVAMALCSLPEFAIWPFHERAAAAVLFQAVLLSFPAWNCPACPMTRTSLAIFGVA